VLILLPGLPLPRSPRSPPHSAHIGSGWQLRAQKSLTLRLLLTIIFHNASSTDMAGTALLGDLETHSLDCRPCKFRFLQPWAQQGLTPKEWQDLEGLIYRYLSGFIHLMNELAEEEGEGCEYDPFVTQFSIGCELHPNDTLRRFCDAGMNSEDFLSFDTDNGKWVTRRGDKLTLKAQESLNYNRVVAITLQFHLRTMCVNTLKSFVQHGNESLARQGEAGHHSLTVGPTPDPGEQILLVCRVTGFYPRPVRVAWLQDGEEVVLGWWLNSSEILPNADLTYQLRSSLAVEPGAGHSYACRVQHSSLGGQSLLIPWGRCTSWSLGAFPALFGICLDLSWLLRAALSQWRSRQDPQNQVN
uniref:Ig-like domain-containing protein n=1 Tax=Chelonoidis abingdonii TaxID=106734 RepID=A0A8C0G8W9_CHEAB